MTKDLKSLRSIRWWLKAQFEPGALRLRKEPQKHTDVFWIQNFNGTGWVDYLGPAVDPLVLINKAYHQRVRRQAPKEAPKL